MEHLKFSYDFDQTFRNGSNFDIKYIDLRFFLF